MQLARAAEVDGGRGVKRDIRMAVVLVVPAEEASAEIRPSSIELKRSGNSGGYLSVLFDIRVIHHHVWAITNSAES